MFRPKHTILSVTTELAKGLDSGSVFVPPLMREITDRDLSQLRLKIQSSLKRHEALFTRYCFITMLLVGNVAFLLVSNLVVSGLVHHDKSTVAGTTFDLLLIFGSSVASAFSLIYAVRAMILGLRIRDKVVELRTYLRILDVTDRTTAKRLLRRAAPELRDLEPIV